MRYAGVLKRGRNISEEARREDKTNAHAHQNMFRLVGGRVMSTAPSYDGLRINQA